MLLIKFWNARENSFPPFYYFTDFFIQKKSLLHIFLQIYAWKALFYTFLIM